MKKLFLILFFVIGFTGQAFADGFCENEKLSEKFKKQMNRLSKKDGWFVPVSTLLEFLKKENNNLNINSKQIRALEWKWLFDKLILGST